MSQIKVNLKRANEASKMHELTGPYTESADVVLDQEFGLTAKALHVAVTGDVVYETPYYDAAGNKVIGVIRGLTPNLMYPAVCTKVLSASPLGPTTATGITWHTGQ